MTKSEKLICEANKYYIHKRIAKIRKNDPKRTNKGLFAYSTGLDFSGILFGGKYISFEVKETQKNYLPIDNIRFSQLITMGKELEFGTNPFLVVFFSKKNEWYSLDYELLKKIIEPYSMIPIRYFIAFGKMIPINNGFPDYLNCESHPRSNEAKKDFPSWMPKRINKSKNKIEKIIINYTDKKERDRRILSAINRGIKNAKNKEIQLEEFKNRVR